ncbi:MAG: hypothetical protein AAF851_21560 [Myxococcota bacterium]
MRSITQALALGLEAVHPDWLSVNDLTELIGLPPHTQAAPQLARLVKRGHAERRRENGTWQFRFGSIRLRPDLSLAQVRCLVQISQLASDFGNKSRWADTARIVQTPLLKGVGPKRLQNLTQGLADLGELQTLRVHKTFFVRTAPFSMRPRLTKLQIRTLELLKRRNDWVEIRDLCRAVSGYSMAKEPRELTEALRAERVLELKPPDSVRLLSCPVTPLSGLSRRVYLQLERRLWVTPSEVAQELGISRHSARAALRRLTALNLVRHTLTQARTSTNQSSVPLFRWRFEEVFNERVRDEEEQDTLGRLVRTTLDQAA